MRVLALLLAASVTAHTQPPEGMRGIVGDPFEHPVAMSAAPEEFFYTVQHETTFDFQALQFFHLHSPTGSATITVDGDVNLSQALKALDGKRVRLTLENATVVFRTIDR